MIETYRGVTRNGARPRIKVNWNGDMQIIHTSRPDHNLGSGDMVRVHYRLGWNDTPYLASAVFDRLCDAAGVDPDTNHTASTKPRPHRNCLGLHK